MSDDEQATGSVVKHDMKLLIKTELEEVGKITTQTLQQYYLKHDGIKADMDASSIFNFDDRNDRCEHAKFTGGTDDVTQDENTSPEECNRCKENSSGHIYSIMKTPNKRFSHVTSNVAQSTRSKLKIVDESNRSHGNKVEKKATDISAKCLICMEIVKNKQNGGISCSMDHFVCWDCTGSFVEMAMEADAISGYVDDGGKLVCPHPQCKSNRLAYDQQILCSTAPREIFNSVVKLLIEINKRKAVQEAVRAEQERHKVQLDHIRQLDDLQREVYLLRLQIINEILTPRCPRCKFAYIDFTGCFALTCGNNSCGAGFCAWCEADCQGDAHSHVQHCAHSPTKDYHGTLEALNIVRNNIRKKKIDDLLQTVNPKVKENLLESMQKDFSDIGLLMN